MHVKRVRVKVRLTYSTAFTRYCVECPRDTVLQDNTIPRKRGSRAMIFRRTRNVFHQAGTCFPVDAARISELFAKRTTVLFGSTFPRFLNFRRQNQKSVDPKSSPNQFQKPLETENVPVSRVRRPDAESHGFQIPLACWTRSCHATDDFSIPRYRRAVDDTV